ncbi:MAG: DoxX family membrane protein [Ignavibacteriae bacterium]|nr:DoxX family membrane protein [Ignavibacteriota bacterium]
MKSFDIQILFLRLALGALFLSIGIDKINSGWLSNSEDLVSSLTKYKETASGFHLNYLDVVALPYPDIWSKLIALGEAAIGASLLLGLLARFSSLVGIFLVVNLHAANGNLYSLSFFQSPWAALVIICFLMLFLARSGRITGLDYYLAKSSPKSFFW